MSKIGVALAGFGSIGRIHLLAYKDMPLVYPGKLPGIRMRGVLRSSREQAEKTAAEEGFERGYSSYEQILEDPEVDVIDLVTPNYLHKDQIIRALRAGKHVLCEKPLGLNGAEADEILHEADSSACRVGMIFNYRFIPAIVKAKALIDQGRLGQVYSFRGEYFHTGYQNPSRPYSWRMDFARSGGGALADLGVHVLDLLSSLLGDFRSVRADLQTYIRDRPLPGDSGKTEAVTVDDAAWLQCTLASGAKGSVEVSRFATGTLDDLNLTVYGSKGSFQFRLMDPGFLYWFDQEQKAGGWTRLETMQHYPGAAIPNTRSVIGWTRFHLENQYRFLEALEEGKPFSPGVLEGAKAQYILDAAYASGASGREEPVQAVPSGI